MNSKIDSKEKVFKLFFESEFTLDESKLKIVNKARNSSIVQCETANQNAGGVNTFMKYHEYEIVTEYGYTG